MTTRPILFSGPMVRALLDGTKTQTRRVVKPQPREHHWEIIPGYELKMAGPTAMSSGRMGVRFSHSIPQNREWDHERYVLCPYGQPGDRLWVRESFAFTDAHEPSYMGSVEYRADNKCMAVDHGPMTVEAPHNCDPRPFDGPWKPSIHMPRWASRITLEITGVRVERLQDISEADAISEGIETNAAWPGGFYRNYTLPDEGDVRALPPRDSYRTLWEQINGPGSWDANPWIWAVEFKTLEATCN